ncbi:kinase-like domain-containing protein [Infundibulicybe gibba]|nr:kinase-like domain-containing protein [Infundibulicybe gibba]
MHTPPTIEVSFPGLAVLPTFPEGGGAIAPNATQLSIMERAIIERANWKMNALNLMNNIIVKEKLGASSGSDMVAVDSIATLRELSNKIENELAFEESDQPPLDLLVPPSLIRAACPEVNTTKLDGKKCADEFGDIVDVDEKTVNILPRNSEGFNSMWSPFRVLNVGKPVGKAYTGKGKENVDPSALARKIKRKPVPTYVDSPSAGLIESHPPGTPSPSPSPESCEHDLNSRLLVLSPAWIGCSGQGLSRQMSAGAIKDMRAEQKILRRLRCNAFIVNLVASFHNSHTFCLVTDFYGGGDLQTALAVAKSFSLDRARFYAAEMASAIHFLHTQNILHRDIKLANVLLKGDGHIAVADFGLSKLVLQSDTADIGCIAQSHCGTMTYMAPEHFLLQSYGPGVDWWSLGVCVFAMLDGKLPFNGDFDELPDLTSLFIQGLLEKDPLKRLGGADIFNHAFFETINWSALEALAVTPPFVPTDDYSVLEHNRCAVGAEIILADPLCYDPYPDFHFVADEFQLKNSSPVPRPVVQIDDVQFEMVTPLATEKYLPASIAAEFGFNTCGSDESLSISVPEDLPSIPSLHSVHHCNRSNLGVTRKTPFVHSSMSSMVAIKSCGQSSYGFHSSTTFVKAVGNSREDKDPTPASNVFTSVTLAASTNDSNSAKDSGSITLSIPISPAVNITPQSHEEYPSAATSSSGFGIVLRRAKALLQLAIKKICTLPKRLAVRW